MKEVKNVQETKLFQTLTKKENHDEYTGNIIKFFNLCEPLLTNVKNILPNFTDHSITHSLRVADYIYDLLPASPDQYDNLELMAMLYIAIGHDLGMAMYGKTTERTPEVQNSIRQEHHLNIESLINDENVFSRDLFCIGPFCIKQPIINICRSHGESNEWITNNLKNDETFGYEKIHPQFLAFLLRLADLIDFDNRRTPQILFDLLSNDFSEISKDEWNKQLSISNYEKIRTENNQKTIYFDGSFSNFHIGLGIYNYIKIIENEIADIQASQTGTEDKFRLCLNSTINNNLTMNNYAVEPLKKFMDYKKISKLLMGEQLYKNRRIALRELLQNAIDACRVKKEINGDSYNPIITIEVDNDYVHIKDNGIGMSKNEIEKYFLSVGNSFYTSKDYSFSYKPISHYGIGFLSCFMLSKEVLIKTTSYKTTNTEYTVFLSKDEEYVFLGKNQNTSFDSGTDICLLKKDFMHVFFNIEEIQQFIESNIQIQDIKFLIKKDNNIVECLTDKEKSGIDLSKYLNNVNCYIDFDKSVFFGISEKQFFGDDFYQTYIYAPNYYPEIIEGEIYKELHEDGKFDFFDLLNEDDEIGILEILELTLEQEEMLEDLYYEVDEEDFVSRFPELFENYSDKYTIYISVDEIEELSEHYVQNHILSDSNYEILTSLTENELFTFVANQFGNGRRFRIQYRTRKLFLTEQLFTYINNDVEIPCINTFFIKGIKISTPKIFLPNIFDEIKFNNIYINIQDNCIPDISREEITDDDLYEIGYAIGKAFLLNILETKKIKDTPLDEDKIQFIQEFVDKYYSSPGKFIM